MAGRKPTKSDREILRVFVDHSDPALFTTEVGDELGFSQPGILKRLRSLEESDLIEGKSSGNSNIWWITESGREHLSEED
jgi:predicted transcriptional regulator